MADPTPTEIAFIELGIRQQMGIDQARESGSTPEEIEELERYHKGEYVNLRLDCECKEMIREQPLGFRPCGELSVIPRSGLCLTHLDERITLLREELTKLERVKSRWSKPISEQ